MTVNKLNYAQSYLIAPIKPSFAFISSQLYLKYSLKVITPLVGTVRSHQTKYCLSRTIMVELRAKNSQKVKTWYKYLPYFAQISRNRTLRTHAQCKHGHNGSLKPGGIS